MATSTATSAASCCCIYAYHTPQASHGNGYTPPSLDQTLTFPVDDPFVNATAGLDDIVEDTPVPSADVETPTASLLQFTGAAPTSLCGSINRLPQTRSLASSRLPARLASSQGYPAASHLVCSAGYLAACHTGSAQ